MGCLADAVATIGQHVTRIGAGTTAGLGAVAADAGVAALQSAGWTTGRPGEGFQPWLRPSATGVCDTAAGFVVVLAYAGVDSDAGDAADAMAESGGHKCRGGSFLHWAATLRFVPVSAELCCASTCCSGNPSLVAAADDTVHVLCLWLVGSAVSPSAGIRFFYGPGALHDCGDDGAVTDRRGVS